MSRMSEHELECPECRREQGVVVWESVNVDLDPSLRQKLVDGQINTFECKSCGHRAFLSVPLLYHDMTRQFCVQYVPPRMLDDPSVLNGYTVDGKMDIDLPGGGPGGQYLTEPHVVFDMGEMVRYVMFRERLYARDHPEGQDSRNSRV